MAGRVKRRVILAPFTAHCTDTHCDIKCNAFCSSWEGGAWCGTFGKRDGDCFARHLVRDDATRRYLRCPECIEAEKRGAK